MSSTVFITGSNSGVGLATTQLFLRKGWNVVATARHPEGAKELQELASGPNGNRLLILPLDLTNAVTFLPALDSTLSKFGAIHVLINNAGYAEYGVIEQIAMEDVRKQFDVNVFGGSNHLTADIHGC